MDKKKTDVPEPPKFNLDDIPEPPRLEGMVPETHEKQIEVPPPMAMSQSSKVVELKQEPVKIQIKKETTQIPNPPKLDIKTDDPLKLPEKKTEEIVPIPLEKFPEPPKLKEKKGLFGGIFKNKKKSSLQDSTFSEPPKLESKSASDSQLKEKFPEPPKFEADSSNKNNVKEPIPMPPKFKDTETSLKKQENLPMDSLETKPVTSLEPPKFELKPDAPAVPIDVPDFKIENEDWVKEGEDYEKEHPEAEPMESKTPLSEVNGIGPAREKLLKKTGIKTAQHLAKHDHKKLAKKLKITIPQAKSIVSHAKKITNLKSKLKSSPKLKKSENITDVIKELEIERKSIERLQDANSDEKIIELEGHKEVVKVLQQLEKKRDDLTKLQTELAQKESKITGHEDSYKRDMEYIDNLKRRLDHDVRERTQYLINLEKEYFQRAQKLAKLQSELDVKERDLEGREKSLVIRETEMKRKLNEFEDRQITVVSKEKKLNKIMDQLDQQDVLLKEKEEDLVKKEAEYLKKLDILENHEKSVLKNLQEKRNSLEKKEKEIELKEERIHKKQRNVDKQSVAVEYAKNVMDEEKSKLIDDEFEQYLHDQLRGTGNINIKDLNTVQNVNVINFDDKSVYKLVDTCRDMLRGNKVSEAKTYYNQLRDKFYSMSFPNQQEKQEMHNQIRQLYDEINLAEINR